METNVCDPSIGGGVSAATDGALAAEIKVPSGFAFGMSKHVAFDTDDVSIYKTFY